ncbi:hypothetical protein KN63_02765 [Smithella sp. F21]|nr:hypothetical protein KN63_02765 [Smithella sp. F21]
MKLALIQDQLLTQAGSERMFQYMVEEFPEADIYTSAYNPQTTWPAFQNHQIKTSWTNYFIKNHGQFKTFYPLLANVFKYWNFYGYDIILSSSATVAKYISRFDGTHICYCYFPTRAIWNTDDYFNKSTKSIKVLLFRVLLSYFKKQDIAAAQRVDKFIGISEYSRRAITQIYGKEADVLYCPIDFERFKQGNSEKKGNHYLIVSRLERWKKLDYAIEAFNLLKLPLKVIGSGADAEEIKAAASDNIQFLGNIDDASLVKEYGRAKAVLFTPELEYGLVPLEANAAGTPVIAYGRGGVTETMLPVNKQLTGSSFPTAVFFDEQTPKSLMAAINQFESLTFDRSALMRHAEKYNIPSFKKALRKYVDDAATEAKGFPKKKR